MAGYAIGPRKVRASRSTLPTGPSGLVYGNSTRIDLGMRNDASLLDQTFGKRSKGDQIKPADRKARRERITLDRIERDSAVKSGTVLGTTRAPISRSRQSSKSHHAATGEDASLSTSQHWAITAEPVTASRIVADALLSGNPTLTTTQAYELSHDVLRHQEVAAARAASRNNRAKRNRTNRIHAQSSVVHAQNR